MEKLPCEDIVWESLPAIRAAIAAEMVATGLSQKEVARILDVITSYSIHYTKLYDCCIHIPCSIILIPEESLISVFYELSQWRIKAMCQFMPNNGSDGPVMRNNFV